jgi:hypothetical protein
MTEHQILKHFPSWGEAVRAAGLDFNPTNIPLDPSVLLEDWGKLVRRVRRIPTRVQYRREGTYSPGVFERKFGPWSKIPAEFKRFAEGKHEWSDVVALLPVPSAHIAPTSISSTHSTSTTVQTISPTHRHLKLDSRATYGNPIDFRGLRHEPVNEQGVVFLFGMVARELGYSVEAIQTGFPDCEAKRQVGVGKWQRVRIEFEYESRNYDHPPEGCDIIVCWHHNWPECPLNIEVIELSTVIKGLATSEE